MMKIIYGNIEIPVVTRRQKDLENQIVIIRKDDTIRFKIILNNDICIGSSKPIVSLTNQILGKLEYKSITTVDYFKTDLSYERILTIKI